MVKEIRALLGSDKLLLGTQKTMKALKQGKISKVYLASNTNKKTVEDIEYYKKISDFQIEKLNETNEELGTICKKSFSVSVIGVLK